VIKAKKLACYTQGGLARELNRDVPPKEAMAAMVKQAVAGAAHTLNSKRGQVEVAHVIEEANEELVREAKRVGVKRIPALPNPKDSAAKIGKILAWANTKVSSP